MTLDRQYGHVIMCCDSCGETLEGDQGEFDEFIAQAKRAGWRIRKIGGEWAHDCPDCTVDF
jgi:Fe2+ or Zn2+ uptake regulation protein